MWLRQSTASQEILLGPFLDSTDGNTAETALTIANTDIKLWVEGGITEANKNIGGATHIAAGRYYTVLDATDTATLGKLEVNVHVAGALAVRRSFMVVPAIVYDALVLGTDNLDVSAVQFAGQTITCSGGVTIPAATIASTTNITAATGVVLSGVTHTGAVIPTVSTVTNGVTVTTNNDKTGYSLTQAFPANFAVMSISATTGLVDITQAAADKAWSTAARVLTAGTNISLAKGTGVTGFNDLDAAGVAAATWNAAIVTYGAAGSYGLLIETNLDAPVSGATAPTAAAVADAVWDEALAGHLAAGTTGNALNAAGAAGDPWTTALPGAYGAGTAGKIIGDNINATISSRLAAAGYTAPDNATIATILADTNELQAAHTAGNLGANVDKINGVTITGNGSTIPFDVV